MKYHKPLVKDILDNLKLGMTRTDTCELLGISYETFSNWCKSKPEFFSAVKNAEMECKKRNVGIVQKASIETWQAAAWWLERKFREEFALRQVLDVKVEVLQKTIVQIVEILKVHITDPALREAIAADLAKVAA